MSDAIKHSHSACQQWRDQAVAAGWLAQDAGAAFDAARIADPGELFTGAAQRPLVLAFFGGTGVGKSSLLNRLAGAAVARTGVIRPTSREVTVHAHESLSLTQLPAQIPADKVRVSAHSDAASSHVVWIDTPDVDSVATEHREQVLAWLPYVDLVIYVVSPERYKDDAGWRLLREAGDQHAWMFALNQWDRGQPEQLADFKAVLSGAGFDQPQVFCTVCTDAGAADDFEQLRSAVQSLGEQHTVQTLVAQAEVAQAQRLRAGVADCVEQLGDEAALVSVRAQIDADFSRRAEQLGTDLSWQINLNSQRFEDQQGGWRQLLGAHTTAPALPDRAEQTLVWDERASQLIKDALTEVSVMAGQHGLPQAPLRLVLQPLADSAVERIAQHQGLELEQALAKPGTRLQRWVFQAVAAVSAGAPIAALGWIGYRVVLSFYGGNTAEGEYVGADFAINSLLLLGVAWLLPALLREKLRPSLKASVARALRQGLYAGVAEVAEEAKKGVAAYGEKRKALVEAGWALVADLPKEAAGSDDALAMLRPSNRAG